LSRPQLKRGSLGSGAMTPRHAVAAAVVLLAGSCVDTFAPPSGTYPFAPPPFYQGLWEQVEGCSGLSGDFAKVRWFAVPQRLFTCPDGECFGVWEGPHNIYVTELAMADSLGNYFTVRHEMLHELLRGGLNHPPAFDTCHLRRY
jgi:hypothetical protein